MALTRNTEATSTQIIENAVFLHKGACHKKTLWIQCKYTKGELFMQPKEIIRCRRLKGNTYTVMDGSEVQVAICNGIEKKNSLFVENVRSVLETCHIPASFSVYENIKDILEQTKKQDIIFHMLKSSVQTELDAVYKLKKKYKNSKLIFVAENGTYLKEAYKAQPFRYLYLSDTRKEIQEALISAINSNRERIGIALEGDGRYYYILLKDILYIEALGDDIGIYSVDGNEYILRMPLKQIYLLLEDEFIRLNRQQVVNARHIKRLGGSGAMLVNNEEIVISGRERKNVAKRYTEYVVKMKL